MESKHTPGPWKLDTWKYEHPGRHNVRMVLGESDAVAEVCTLWRDGDDDTAEREANARLIAAAPTMYNYLTKLAHGGDNEANDIITKITRP